VTFTADHGIAFPSAKTTLFDFSMELSLIVRYPDRFDGGQVFDQLISNVDLLPTLLELAGQDARGDIDSRSFLSLLRGDVYVPRGCLPSRRSTSSPACYGRSTRSNT
jgi:arylsulfatase A-like enzyme